MDFEKIQVSISLTKSSSLQAINMINFEIGCKNSYGEIIWKSLARIKDNNLYKKIDYNGTPKDVLEQATWKEFSEDKIYVFDFSSSDAKEIHIKQTTSNKNDNSIKTDEFKFNTSKKEYVTNFFTLKIANLEI